MIAATSGASRLLTLAGSSVPSGRAGSGRTSNPAPAAEAGLVPCADSGTRTILRVPPSTLGRDGGPDSHHAASLAVRTRSRRHGDGVHPGHGHQPAGEIGDKFKGALHG